MMKVTFSNGVVAETESPEEAESLLVAVGILRITNAQAAVLRLRRENAVLRGREKRAYLKSQSKEVANANS